MAKRRIAIVGGGIAGLTAAFELTRTARLREQFEVTVYQLGWRLGGKCASGVDEQGRNVEHGLHIWFGYYENTFALLNAVYDEWRPPEEQKIRRVAEAVKRNWLTPIGNGEKEHPGWYMVRYPFNKLEPGKGEVQIDVLNSLIGLLNVGAKFVEDLLHKNDHLKKVHLALRNPAALSRMRVCAGLKAAGPQGAPCFGETPDHLRAIADAAARIKGERALYMESELQAIIGALADLVQASASGRIANLMTGNLMSQLVEVKAAFAVGIMKDVLLGQIPIADLDQHDLRDWLHSHGARRQSVQESPYVRAIYDTMFQYPEGDRENPRYGAGTAAQVVLRMLGTYAGTLAWKLAAGTGSAVIAPVYQVLQERGVNFRFFHKLTQVGLLDREDTLSTLEFDRQVEFVDPAREYDPLRMCNGLLSWGETPDWSLIKDGDALREAGVDLESHWCTQKADVVTMTRGADFDDAILAIPLGAFKRLNDDPGPCDQLIQRSQRFRMMTRSQRLVPSVSVHLWSTMTLEELGWKGKSPAAVAGPGTLGIWADMSRLLAHENPVRANGPKSLHYLCDVFKSDDYKLPIVRPVVPTGLQPHAQTVAQVLAQSKAQAQAQAQAQAKTRARSKAHEEAHTEAVVFPWFGVPAIDLWSKAGSGGKFDWNILYVHDKKLVDAKRLSEQVVRFNVDPGGCCVSSAPRTTVWRLKCDASGFDHLYLAGSWIDTGFNTECIEAAVMSGMQVARAITGEARAIPGEHFMHPEFGDALPCELVRDAVSWVVGIGETVGPE